MELMHDSRTLLYRDPAGALPCGHRATLRLTAQGASVRSACLRLWWDDAEKRMSMRPSVLMPGLFECSFVLPEHPGLLWYYFIIKTERETFYYGNAADQMGGEGAAAEDEPPSFQLTVYDAAYQTPDWMKTGVMYQILPDRFFASEPLKKKPLPPGGRYHNSWSEIPALKIEKDTGDNLANDFFGGDLRGIECKLPYLRDLGVTVLYLNPIFQSASNHKYNTGDYKKIDPSFGTEEDFRSLCASAKKLGIRILLDGVFSHTGNDSRYFNRFGRYDSVGAYQSADSPYASWYHFKKWPDIYDAWWGFPTLPNVQELAPSYLDFILRDPDAVIARWLARGASGWRLDVADELPLPFLRMLRQRVKHEDPQAAVLGEVWEDASNKVSYGELRCYCLGDTLDSVMNYPLRDELIRFMLGRTDARRFKRRMDAFFENYPKPFLYALMNLLGSHDKARILNVLSGAEEEAPRSERSYVPLTANQYILGSLRLKALWRFLCALPGMPSLYYGDEAGAQGTSDPFCRGTYPWGAEDGALLTSIRESIHMRHAHDALSTGYVALLAREDVLIAARWIQNGRDVFARPAKNERLLCLLNRAGESREITLYPADLPEFALTAPLPYHVEALSCVLLPLE